MTLHTRCWKLRSGEQKLEDLSDVQATHWNGFVEQHYEKVKAIIMTQQVVVLIPSGKITLSKPGDDIASEINVSAAGELQLDECSMEDVPKKSCNPFRHQTTSEEDLQDFFEAVLKKLNKDKDVLHRLTQDDEFYITIFPREDGSTKTKGVLGLRPKPIEIVSAHRPKSCIIL